MYERSLAARLAAHRRSLLLLGPRQVGKSTLLQGLGPDLTLNLASPSTYREYVARPERLEAELAAAPAQLRTVFLDEVQHVPQLLDVVQVVADAHPRRFRFLLSGSSARKLRRGQANLLPGRVLVQHLHPLLAAELGGDFDVDRVLAHGSLPGIYSEPDPALRAQLLRSYADSYLREEVQAEALVRDIGAYARLLDLVAAASGRILNLHALSKDAGIAYETARRYLDVLEDTLLVARVPGWSGSDRTSALVHPKLLFFDLGVRNALLRRPLDRPLDDERGLLLEHLVGLELHRRCGQSWPDARLFHFRTRRGVEIDYVLEVGRELWAIEVKAATRVDERVGKGIEALSGQVSRVSRRIVVFLGARPQRMGPLEVLPLETFLGRLPT